MKQNADKARALAPAELTKHLNEAAEQMFRIRLQMSLGQTDGLKKMRQLRKERARLLTVQREREMDAASGKAPQGGKRPAASKAGKGK